MLTQLQSSSNQIAQCRPPWLGVVIGHETEAVNVWTELDKVRVCEHGAEGGREGGREREREGGMDGWMDGWVDGGKE